MKTMFKPEIEFVRFAAEDIITTSGGGGDSSKGQVNFSTKTEVAPAAEAPANSTLFGNLEWNHNFSGQ